MWLLPAVLLLAAGQAEVSVKSLDNSTQHGRLVDLTSQEIVLDTDGEQRTLLLEDLIGISPVTAPVESKDKPSVWIALSDGSMLLAKDYLVGQGTTNAQLLGGGELKLKTAAVRWARFKEQTPAQAAEWAKVIESDVTGDLIVIRKNDRIDFLEGVVEDLTAETVNFRLDGELVPVRREKVEGVVYFHPAAVKHASPVGVVHDAAGSDLRAVELKLEEGGLRIVTASGLEIARPLSAIRRIDFSAGKIEYLSEIEPRSIEWTPFFGGDALDKQLAGLYQPRMNHPIANDTTRGDEALLQLRETNKEGVPEIRTYAKGIALHSRTEITWQLPDEFESLKAVAGIDARFRNLGNVELVISGDGKELYRSTISGQDEPKSLDINISGVRKLSILVDFGKNLDFGDHLNLCNARVMK